jgi:hypothetical protein
MCDSGGWGALCSLGIRFLVRLAIFSLFVPRGTGSPLPRLSSYLVGAAGRDENSADSLIRSGKRLIVSIVWQVGCGHCARLVVENNIQK